MTREILVRPDTAGAHPIVLLLPALGAPLVDPGAEQLMRLLAKAGIGSLRIDPPRASWREQIAAYGARVHALAGERDISSVFLFGHSLGGILAPFVAGDVAGIAVYGTPSRPWCDVLCDGARRQFALAGLPLEDVQREAESASRLYRMLLREGCSAAEALAQEPNSIAARDLRGETLFGIELALLRELDALDLAAAWRNVQAPVLALRGEHDWIVALDDHERIASWAPRGEAVVVAGIDHDMQHHASRRASFDNRGRGSPTDHIARLLAEWIRRR